MRGKILAYDREANEGHVTGDDGRRYRFATRDWRAPALPAAGQKVDFEAEGDAARAVYPVGRAPAFGRDTTRSRIAAAMLGIFLGWAGVHKFYTGRYAAGAVMLGISGFGLVLAGIPTTIMAVIGLFEGVIYLLVSGERFQQRYVRGTRDWF